jgi:hypothetical protein
MAAPPLPLTDPDLGLEDGFRTDTRTNRNAYRAWMGMRLKTGTYARLFAMGTATFLID